MRPLMKSVMAVVCLGIAACAEGSPSQPAMDIPPPAVVMPDLCGNGKVDVNGLKKEDCDCGPTATGLCMVPGMDCSAVGRGTGALLCNPKPMCTFDYSMCSVKTGSTGGMGAVTGAGNKAGTGGTGR